MIFKSRLLVGILLAIVIAGGLGLVTAQEFPSGPRASTNTIAATSTLVYTSTIVVASSVVESASTTNTPITTAAVTGTTTILSSTAISTAIASTATLTVTGSVSSTTSVCGNEYCGNFSAMSPSLLAGNSSVPYGTLTFTLNNSGGLNVTIISIDINGTQVAQVRGVSINQTVTYLIQLAPSVGVVLGQTYEVQIFSTSPYVIPSLTEFFVVAR